MSMTVNEIRENARMQAIAELMPVFEKCSAVKWGDANFAMLYHVGEQEVWVSCDLTVKAWKPTKVSPVFDPYEKAAEWEEEKKVKAGVKAAKAEEKAKKIVKKEKKA